MVFTIKLLTLMFVNVFEIESKFKIVFSHYFCSNKKLSIYYQNELVQIFENIFLFDFKPFVVGRHP